ncbi:MFS transporter [Burkholderia singularis]|uniref:MFS transporter n=1 Tax=Burkholderia singularis TaxID=1503053 RepID=A0A124P9D8_9BURK|nr:MFS transporter [Burkholderia singularis]KVE28208.1 MFS transporter [Burkholderia singularis]
MESAQLNSKRPLYWLALGAFALSTEGFMIAPLLPSISSDLSVSVGVAGLLVTVFAFAYAISSPILTTLTGNLNRRILLIFSLAAFTVANVAAWYSTSFFQLMGARILLAFAAGLYLPNANAVAGSLVAPEQRGRALSIVNGGSSLAIALGVPFGSIIASFGSWRTTFASVAVLGAIGTVGLLFGLPKGFGKGLPTATLTQRVQVASRPAVLMALMSTMLWAAGAYTVYTYIAAYIGDTLKVHGSLLSGVLFVWGVSAVTGMISGGRLTDRLGSHRVIVLALSVLTAAFVALSAINAYVPPPLAVVPVIVAVILWGASVWGFIPPQQSRLIGIGGVNVAPVALSLNASFMYIGFSLGSALGGFALSRQGVGSLGLIGAALEAVSLGIVLLTARKKAARAATRELVDG